MDFDVEKFKERRYLFSLTLLVFVVAATTAVVLTDEGGDSYSVWDCTFTDKDTCIQTEITEYQDCEEGDTNCEYTSEGIEEVSMFTDQVNYVKAPMTDEEYSVESLDVGDNAAWDAEFLDNGTFLYTELDGKLVHHDGENEIDSAEVGTEKFGNTGLLGVAADPEFEENRYVYLYYYKGEWQELDPDPSEDVDPIYNRVSRFTYENGELTDEEVLIDDIDGSSGHSGGRIDIDPEGYLYVTTGDSEFLKSDYEELYGKAQEPDFLGGKVLRTTLDGEIPETNPKDSYVYAKGLRNPQGIDFHPETGDPYVSMHGPWRYDEVNRIEPGANYGWPAERCGEPYEETVEAENTTDPVYCFDEWTLAPSGTTFVDDKKHPWYGYYFVTGLRGSMVYAIDLDGEETEGEVFYIRETEEIDNRLRNVEFHEGSLYLFGDGYGVGKLTPEE